MAWFDELFLPPGVTYPISPALSPRPNFWGPGAYQGMGPGAKNPVAGINEAVYGSPFIPTQFDDKPNTFRPGAAPGQLDVAPKPPLPPTRNPAPAMFGQKTDTPYDPPINLAQPAAQPPATLEASPARKPFDWSENASLWPMLMQAGQGLMQPSYYGLGGQLQQGLSGAMDAAQRAPDQQLKRQLLKAQVGEAEGKAEQRKSLRALYADKSLPMALRLAAQTGDMGKFAETYMKLDPETQRALAQNEAVKAAMVSAATLGDRMKIAEVAAGKAPAGYRWGPDGKLETIPGGPATHISADVAGRLAMMQTAKADLAKSRAVFLKEWSTKDIANAQISAGEIGRAQRNVTLAIESALRAMTGAAAPETEVRKYEGMFMPKSYDTLETRQQKLRLLEGFMANAMKIATQGRGDLPAAPSAPSAPATPSAPKRTGTLPGGIKWSEE